MESSPNELHCLDLESEDLDRLGSVANAYFNARENDEDAFDSLSENSSSEEDDDDNSVDFKEDEDVELMDVHISEQAKVQKFFAEICNCKLGPDDNTCSLTLMLDDIADSRNNCRELTSTELDLVILGTIQSSLNCNDSSVSGRVEKDQQHQEWHTSTTEKEFV